MQITVLSILQPWASLVVMGVKKIETRSFDTKFRGELYIHASLGKKYGDEKLSCRELCYQDPFKLFIDGGKAYDKLPFGQIIGKVNLVDTHKTDEHEVSLIGGPPRIIRPWENDQEGVSYLTLTWLEYAFGDYSPNRYGWLLSNPVKLDTPIQVKGKLGFWNYDLDG